MSHALISIWWHCFQRYGVYYSPVPAFHLLPGEPHWKTGFQTICSLCFVISVISFFFPREPCAGTQSVGHSIISCESVLTQKWRFVLPFIRRKQFLKNIFWKAGLLSLKAKGCVWLPCRGVGTKAASVEVNGNPSVALWGPIIVDLFCYHQKRKKSMTGSAFRRDAFFFPSIPHHLLFPFPLSSKEDLCARLFCCLGTVLEYLQEKERKQNPESHAFPCRLAPSLQLSSAGAACQSHASTNRCDSRALSGQWKRHYLLNYALKAAKFTSLRIFHWDRQFLRALLQGAGIWVFFIYLFSFPLCADIIPTFSI